MLCWWLFDGVLVLFLVFLMGVWCFLVFVGLLSFGRVFVCLFVWVVAWCFYYCVLIVFLLCFGGFVGVVISFAVCFLV